MHNAVWINYSTMLLESFDKAIDMLDVYDKTKKDEIVERGSSN